MAQVPVVRVNVTVNATGNLQCSPNPVIVSSRNTLVVFDLQTSGYAFPATGAVVMSNPGSQFPYAAWSVSAGCAAVLDLNTANGSFNYTAFAVHLESGERIRVDPTIKNEI